MKTINLSSKSVSNFFVFLFLTCFSISHAQDETSNSLVTKGLSALAVNDTAKAIEFFNESIKTNKNESAYFQLALIYFDRTNEKNYLLVDEYLYEAIDLNPSNYKTWYLKGRVREWLFEYDGIRYVFSKLNAINAYKKTIELNPNHFDAHFRLGMIFKREFDEFNISALKFHTDTEIYDSPFDQYQQAAFKQKQQFDNETNSTTLKYDTFSKNIFKESEKYLAKAVELMPFDYEASKNLALLFQEAGQPEISKEYLIAISDSLGSPDLYQLLGLLYYENDENDNAIISFENAMESMDEESRNDFKFNSVKLLIENEIKDKPEIKSEKDTREYIEFFWKLKDPLYLSDYNERLLEHYYRVAYANIKFGVEKLNITGWKTDRGEMLIRYGIPSNNIRLRASSVKEVGSVYSDDNPYGDRDSKDLFVNENTNLNDVEAKTEVWSYPDFTLAFTDPFNSGNYTFSTPTDGMASQYLGDTQMLVEGGLRKNTPEKYQPKFEGPLFYFNYNVCQFKNEKNSITDYIVNYEVENHLESEKSDYEVGIFLFDKNLNQKRKELFDWNTETEGHSLENDTSIVTINSTFIKPTHDGSNFALEMIRKNDKGIASQHKNIPIKIFNKVSLALSDILVAYDISEPDKYPLIRGDYSILPNITGSLGNDDLFFIYYEIYNLCRAKRLTDFEQKIKITPLEIDDKSALEGVMEIFGVDEEGNRISLAADYQTIEASPKMFTQIDLGEYRNGTYNLTIEIKDKLCNKTISASTTFRINKE